TIGEVNLSQKTEPYGWYEIAGEIRKLSDNYPTQSKPFIFTNDMDIAAKLSFMLPQFRVVCINTQIDDFDIWQRNMNALRNKNALFVSFDRAYFDPRNYGEAFESYGDEKDFEVLLGGKVVKTFYITPCRFFRPNRLDPNYTSERITEQKNVLDELARYDHSVFKFINVKMHNKILDYPMSWISFLDSKGINFSFLLIAFVSIVILWKNKRENFWTTFALFVSALILSTIVSFSIKNIVERPRPLEFFGVEDVKYFYEMAYKNSFPSGHTQAAFAMCVFVFMNVRKYWYVYFVLAFGTAFERIYVGSHFPSDVFVGAVLGTVTSYMVVKLAELFDDKKKGLKQ
ncbi:MAG: phosphatase PAP2 family protein, partial [Elusimicrobiota bacterium]|nr:phosphatase PAP2 family protein [Elusimicrobiota bacterium]